jgi:hypothetical protein
VVSEIAQIIENKVVDTGFEPVTSTVWCFLGTVWAQLQDLEIKIQNFGNPSSQVHGPGAIQFVGLCLSEERAKTTGDRNPLTEAMISLNEEGI